MLVSVVNSDISLDERERERELSEALKVPYFRVVVLFPIQLACIAKFNSLEIKSN